MKKTCSVKVISITPFTKTGDLDEQAYRLHLRRLADAGVTVWVAGSGTSEGYTLSAEERDRVLAISVEELKGKVPVHAMGCEPRLTSEMVDFLAAAERSGVDAAQIFSLQIGHTTKVTPREMRLYYETALSATDMPLYLSSHSASGYFIPIDMIEALADKYPNLAGVAYGGSDIQHFAELIGRLKDRMEVHCAGPANALTCLGLGGHGFMGGEGNFSPRMVQNVIDAWHAEDRGALRDAFATLMAFASVYARIGGGSAARGLKPLMNAYGLPGGELRLPRLPIEETELQQLIALVRRIPIPGVPEPQELAKTA
ncbi:dihydrodipicolinate synthase family protein [Frigidibacter sp. MR17.14]|uniref:dihydrodipicolinate synthase family protein n=1 Tax=Frigidibacter sp. MR17.14 TaxID=3126509 RepID=UPI003012E24C